MPRNDCPCGLGASLKSCCGRYLTGAVEPPTPESLMRSRYTAYATGAVEHLWRTLDAEHPDRAGDQAAWLLELRPYCRRMKFLGLTVSASTPPDAEGVASVTFAVRLFESGADRSFGERSLFRHDGTGWRYWRGTVDG